MKYGSFSIICQNHFYFELPSVVLKKELRILETSTLNIIALKVSK